MLEIDAAATMWLKKMKKPKTGSKIDDPVWDDLTSAPIAWDDLLMDDPPTEDPLKVRPEARIGTSYYLVDFAANRASAIFESAIVFSAIRV